LCKELKEIYNLKGTKKLIVEKFVAMFLNILGYGFVNRIMQEMFQHLGKTVSRHFTRILMAVLRMTIDIINPINREFRDIQAKFVMMSSIGHTSKFIFEPLMELIYQLKFLHQNKYYILVEK
jgi:hypothetical protein